MEQENENKCWTPHRSIQTGKSISSSSLKIIHYFRSKIARRFASWDDSMTLLLIHTIDQTNIHSIRPTCAEKLSSAQ